MRKDSFACGFNAPAHTCADPRLGGRVFQRLCFIKPSAQFCHGCVSQKHTASRYARSLDDDSDGVGLVSWTVCRFDCQRMLCTVYNHGCIAT